MKTTIASLLVRNATEYVKEAEIAHLDSDLQHEASASVGAHLMLALALEAIGNKVGYVAFGGKKGLWDRLEKVDTVTKWYILSTVGRRKAFDSGGEPLQPVEYMMKIRNNIAHPKVIEMGDEIIIRSMGGEVHRHVQRDRLLEDGDTILVGLGKLTVGYGKH
jgi:hypothetical protein